MVLQPDDFVVGPCEARARVGWWWCDGGGIDIDYCAFPTCPGNPRGIVSAPALCFCMLLPPLSSPTLSTSHRQLLARAVSPSVCLSRFLSLSLSLTASTSSFSFSLRLSLHVRQRPRGIDAPADFLPGIDSALRSLARGCSVIEHGGSRLLSHRLSRRRHQRQKRSLTRCHGKIYSLNFLK